MDAKTYIEDLRSAYRNSDDSAVARLVERLRGEAWPTVALVCYRLMAIARPSDVESRWHSAVLAPVLLEAFESSRSVNDPRPGV